MNYRFTVRLKEKRDQDLILWLQGLGEGERSCFIRNAIRKAITIVNFTNQTNSKSEPAIDDNHTTCLGEIDKPLEQPASSEEIISAENKLNKMMDSF